MELKDRLQIILNEQDIKQKDLANTIKVSESYVSNMLKGKRKNISESLASLIEQKYGYSAQWILYGEGEPYIKQYMSPYLSPTKKRLIAEIEKMSDSEINAIKIFIDSLDKYKKALTNSEQSPNNLFEGIPGTPEELEQLYPPVSDNDKITG